MLFSYLDYNKIIYHPVAFPSQGGHCSAAGKMDPKIFKISSPAKTEIKSNRLE